MRHALAQTTAALTIQTREVQDVMVVVCSGKITLQETNLLFRSVEGLIKMGKIKIILDLTDVGYIDASAIGCIKSILRIIASERFKGRLRLCGLVPRVKQCLEIAGEHDLLGLAYEDERYALESINS